MAITFYALTWRRLLPLQSLSGPQSLTHTNSLLFWGVPQGSDSSRVWHLTDGSQQRDCGARLGQQQGPVQLTSSWRAPEQTPSWPHEGHKGLVPIMWLRGLDAHSSTSPTPTCRLWHGSGWEEGREHHPRRQPGSPLLPAHRRHEQWPSGRALPSAP